MTLRYTIMIEPGQAATLSEALRDLHIPFDENDSLLALPVDFQEDGIFQGDQLDQLIAQANQRLSDQRQEPMIRSDHWNLPLQARYDFLGVMVNDADWEGYRLNHISPPGWAGFIAKHPEAATRPEN